MERVKKKCIFAQKKQNDQEENSRKGKGGYLVCRA
jgi:hypothetical protein